MAELAAKLDAHATTRSAKQFLSNVRQLQSAIRQAELRGADPKYLGTLKAEGRASILSTLRADQETERKRLGEELAKEKARFEADVEKNLERVDTRARMAERKYAAMGDAELQALVPTPPMDPSAFDALSAELVGRGLTDDHGSLRALGAKARVHEPWTRTPNGAAILRELALNAGVSGAGILLDYGVGRTGSESFDGAYEKLLEQSKEAASE